MGYIVGYVKINGVAKFSKWYKKPIKVSTQKELDDKQMYLLKKYSCDEVEILLIIKQLKHENLKIKSNKIVKNLHNKN